MLFQAVLGGGGVLSPLLSYARDPPFLTAVLHCRVCKQLPLNPLWLWIVYSNYPFGMVFYFINKQWPFINKFKQWRKSVSIRGEICVHNVQWRIPRYYKDDTQIDKELERNNQVFKQPNVPIFCLFFTNYSYNSGGGGVGGWRGCDPMEPSPGPKVGGYIPPYPRDLHTWTKTIVISMFLERQNKNTSKFHNKIVRGMFLQ